MNTPRSSAWRILSLVLMLALIAVACGDSGDVTDGESASSQPTADSGNDRRNHDCTALTLSDLEGEIFHFWVVHG